VALYLMAIKLGRARGVLDVKHAQQQLEHLTELPKFVEGALQTEEQVKQIAKVFKQSGGFLFLGRGPMHSVALEGALKLKEITYIHAEGYAGGEMKHGPIALIDDKLPVVVIAPDEPAICHEKMIGNVEEVRARGGQVVAVVEEGESRISKLANHVIFVPKSSALMAPVVTTVPLQLLAYHVADLRGNDVDQPRNLAKSVTVE
jgi:glucosamine--fructose-6-phosphate aminotransferase (isomerizing)